VKKILGVKKNYLKRFQCQCQIFVFLAVAILAGKGQTTIF
jgi:hypothetical protein